MPRPEYTQEDNNDRIAIIGSRSDVLSRSFVADLWMGVLQRAISDLISYRTKRANNQQLTSEELRDEATAEGFIFEKGYTIPFDDYQVKVICSKCRTTRILFASIVASQDFICSECGHITTPKTTHYIFVQDQKNKETTLDDLISLWDIEDVDAFRSSINEKINEQVDKRKREPQMPKKADREHDKFDKAVDTILKEIGNMLKEKNRRYGNSAVNPVRAFSKADNIEQIKVRVDDKISRLVHGDANNTEDTRRDLIGYLVILDAAEKGLFE